MTTSSNVQRYKARNSWRPTFVSAEQARKMRKSHCNLILILVVALSIVIAMLFQSMVGESDVYIRRGRELDERAHFDVQLYLDLQFVDETLAMDFETLDDTNANVIHFCRAIQTQVS